jgi:hypothetical protein
VPRTDPRRLLSAWHRILQLADDDAALATLLEIELAEARARVVATRRARLYVDLRDSDAQALLHRALLSANEQAHQQTYNAAFTVRALRSRLAALRDEHPELDAAQLTPSVHAVTLDHAPWLVAVAHAQGQRDEMQDAHVCTVWSC